MVEPARHRIQESAQEAVEAVNNALAANLKFVTFTRESGKKFSVVAANVVDITEE